MLIEDVIIMNYMYQEFSSRICALDLKGFKNPDSFEQSNVKLTVNSHVEENVRFLKKYNYADLIGKLLMYCELTDNLKDACKPFINDEEFYSIRKEFRTAQEHLSYIWQDDGLLFIAPSFFVDIVLFPVSQFHSQIIMAMEDFHIYDNGLDEFNVFLNAKTPSFFTQFSQYWVMEKINKLEVDVSNIVVV